MPHPKVALVVTTIAAMTAMGRPAAGQPADTVTAEALFQQGRDLLLQGNAAAACPKLAESLRIDPATGTLIALAMCHEKEGKLASAWAEFTDVEGRARREGREDREKLARESAANLRPRLSTLDIKVAEAVATTPGIEVRRNGVPQGAAVWNAPVPIDGGTHVIEATAPGKKSFKISVAVKPERDAQAVVVPALENATADPVPLVVAPPVTSAPVAPRPESPPRDEPSKPFGTLEWIGIGTAGAGVVVLGVGGYFLATALGEKSDSENNCDGDLCNDQGLETRKDMVGHGNTATVFGIGGAVLVGAGATLYLVGRSSGSDAANVSVSVETRQTGAAIRLRGRF